MDEKAVARFWGKVKKGAGCWEWTGGRGNHKYGVFYPKHGVSALAHRVSWELAHGAIPDGMHVLHRCDNRPCVNPSHLFLGTNDDNIADKVSKGRQSRGEDRTFAKLTEADVMRIRDLVRAGISVRQIATTMPVHERNVLAAATGEAWSHVPGAITEWPEIESKCAECETPIVSRRGGNGRKRFCETCVRKHARAAHEAWIARGRRPKDVGVSWWDIFGEIEMGMNSEKILSATENCRQVLRYSYMSTEPEQIDEKLPAVSQLRAAKHMLWLCEQIKEQVNGGNDSDAECLLTFVQGALWLGNYATLEQLKNMNKPDAPDADALPTSEEG